MPMEILETTKNIYTPSEVMELFSISRVTFSEWCRKGVFEKIEIPGQRRVYVTGASVRKVLTPKK